MWNSQAKSTPKSPALWKASGDNTTVQKKPLGLEKTSEQNQTAPKSAGLLWKAAQRSTLEGLWIPPHNKSTVQEIPLITPTGSRRNSRVQQNSPGLRSSPRFQQNSPSLRRSPRIQKSPPAARKSSTASPVRRRSSSTLGSKRHSLASIPGKGSDSTLNTGFWDAYNAGDFDHGLDFNTLDGAPLDVGAYDDSYGRFPEQGFAQASNDMGLGIDYSSFDVNGEAATAVWNMYNQPRVSLPSNTYQPTYPDPTQGYSAPYQQAYEPEPMDSVVYNGGGYQDQYMDPRGFSQQYDSNFIDPSFYDTQTANNRLVGSVPPSAMKRKRAGSIASEEPSSKRLHESPSNNVSAQASPPNERPSTRSSAADESELRRRKKRKFYRPSWNQGNFKAEKPKLRKDKPWVRINATTTGTSRTAKINHFAPEGYEDRPHPIGREWTSTEGNTFTYTKNWEFGELSYSAEEIRDFIFNYPTNKRTHAKLKLWIQKSPTDSAARYHSEYHSKCRFKDCPAQIYQSGSILHGHYRVAFDERWHAHGSIVDPFHVAGFAHLYCMERFLDFEAVCKLGIVEVDDRPFPNDLRGAFPGTLFAQPEYGIAAEFVDAATNGDLRRDVQEFKNYPVHAYFRAGKLKHHQDTLTYWMHKAKLDSRPFAQFKQFKDRGLKPSHIVVHMGDLEVSFSDAAKAKANSAKTKKRGQKVPYDDSFVVQALEAAKNYHAHARERKRPSGSKRKGVVEVQDKDDSDLSSVDLGDSDDDDNAVALPSPVGRRRSSPRFHNQDRKRYAEEEPYPLYYQTQAPKRQRVASQAGQQDVPAQYYRGYQPVQPGTPTGNFFYEGPTFDYDPNHPDFNDFEFLHRHGSRASVNRSPSTLTALRTSMKGSPSWKKHSFAGSPRKVSYGGVTTHLFDNTVAPTENLRRSSRHLGKK